MQMKIEFSLIKEISHYKIICPCAICGLWVENVNEVEKLLWKII